jgi:hypothetical protein
MSMKRDRSPYKCGIKSMMFVIKSVEERGSCRIHKATFLLSSMNLNLNISFKGTVSRDCSSPVSFFKLLLLVSIGMSRNDFKFFRIFMEIFVFVIDSLVMNTPGSRLESLGRAILLNIFEKSPKYPQSANRSRGGIAQRLLAKMWQFPFLFSEALRRFCLQ